MCFVIGLIELKSHPEGHSSNNFVVLLKIIVKEILINEKIKKFNQHVILCFKLDLFLIHSTIHQYLSAGGER